MATDTATAEETIEQASAKDELFKLVGWASSTINLSFQRSAFRSTGTIGRPLNTEEVARVVATIMGVTFEGRDNREDFTPADALKFVEGVIRWCAEELDIALPLGE